MDDADLKELLLLEIGDDGTVASTIDVIWAMYSNYAVYQTADPRFTLQFRLAERHAIRILMGATARKKISFQEKDRRQERREFMLNLKMLYDMVDMEIKEVTFEGQSASGPEVGMRTPTGMVESPAGFPDANDRMYSGDPNINYWPVQR